jgi:hypothetical protein
MPRWAQIRASRSQHTATVVRSPEPLLLTHAGGPFAVDRAPLEHPVRISMSPAAQGGGTLSPPMPRTASRSRSPSPLAVRGRSPTPPGVALADDVEATRHSENLATRMYGAARLALRLLVVLAPEEADEATGTLPGAEELSCLQRQVCTVAHDLWHSASWRSSSSSLARCAHTL